MNCPQCNWEISEDMETCPQCGELLTEYEEGNTSEYHAPGKNFIKIISIIGLCFMIIGGCVIGCTVAVLNMDAMTDEFAAMGIENPLEELTAMMPPAVIIYFIILVLFQLFVYTMGLLHCANLEKASFLRTLASVQIGLVAIQLFFGFMQASGVLDMLMIIFMLPFLLAIPVLYYIGANKNLIEYNS